MRFASQDRLVGSDVAPGFRRASYVQAPLVSLPCSAIKQTANAGDGCLKGVEPACHDSTVLFSTTGKVAKNLAGRAATGISVGQAFQPDTLKSQAGKPDLLKVLVV
jgi:hypothetical protein